MTFCVHFINFIWTTVVNALSAVISCILSIIVLDLILVELLKIHIGSCLPYYIMGTVTGLIAGFVFTCICFAKPNIFFYTPESYNVKKPPRALTVYLGFLLIFLIYTGGSVLSICLFKDTFNSLMPLHDDWTILFNALGSFASSTLIFWIVTQIKYSGSICPNCSRMFSVDRTLMSSDSSESVQYKTKTTNEKVGTVKCGDSETSIYSDVTRGYSRNVKEWVGRYACYCTHCGHKFNDTESDKTYGKWE